MKKCFIAAVVVLLFGVAFWFLVLKRPKSATPAQHNGSSPASNEIIIEGVPISQEVVDYVHKRMADPQYDWKQPINFYGRVVDESNQPIDGASVDFKWTDLSIDGNSQYHTTSDTNGLFSMVNRRGKRLSVSAAKSGYYSSADARLASFEYANPADGLFKPNPTNPIALHLRKKGLGVALITSELGVKKEFGVTMPIDGAPVRVDFLARKAAVTGAMVMSQTKPAYEHWKQATKWMFRMEIPDGGFVVQNDEFPFEAPETGYQTVLEFRFQKGTTNWTDAIMQKYYIKFGSPPRYGWLKLETAIEMKGARLTYAINPDGSRNLEPK